MNIIELFKCIENNFSSDELNGEFLLDKDCIIWEYNLKNNEDYDSTDDKFEEEEYPFDFNSESNEEVLREAYDEDYDLLEEYLDDINEYEDWTFSEPEIFDNIISFKIFK